MSHELPFIFAANWKMNHALKDIENFVPKFKENVSEKVWENSAVILAPQSIHLMALGKLIQNSRIQLSAQNCGPQVSGAFTGEVSAAQIKEAGASWVIIGHSERRHVFKETEELLASRLKIALQEGLNVIYCVGELLEERKKGTTFEVIEKQLSNLKAAIATLGEAVSSRIVIAYEPVWAIGTGENATPDQAEEAHAYIRGWWKKNAHNAEALRILYGGSVKPENAKSLMAEMDVDGLLVGGSSLDPNAFAEIIKNGLLSAL